MFKKKELNKIEQMLKDTYLIGIDASKGFLEIRVYDPKTNTISADFFNITDEKIISSLHDRRRVDSLKMFNDAYNDIYINQIDEDNKAVMSFDKIDNKVQISYDVSTNLVRRLSELEFIRQFIDLYSEDRVVYSVNKSVIDLNKYRENKMVVYEGCSINLLDKQNYVKDLHINGKLLCAEFIPSFEELKELQKNETERKI